MPDGDGSIIINVSADDKDAQRTLNKLRRDIEKTARALDSTNTKRNGIAEQLQTARDEAKSLSVALDEVNQKRAEAAAKMSANAPGRSKFAAVDPAEYAAAREDYVRLGEEQTRINNELTAANKNVSTLEAQEQKVLTTLQAQTEQLRQQKAQAGAIERTLVERTSGAQFAQVSEGVANLSKQMRKSVGSILKWGFGIRSAFILIRRLRSALIEGVKAFAEQDEETKKNINGLKSSLATLKASWGAAFAPIVNAVAPLLQRLISWLTAAANAVQAFFAALSGKGSYKRAIANNEALADSYSGAGGAAADAKKEIMGFDEINKLNDNSGGGGGGGAAQQPFEDAEVGERMAKIAGFVKEHLQDILNLAKLVGIALLAWKIAPLLTLSFTEVLGLLVGIWGVIEMVKGAMDAWNNGVNLDNLKQMLFGATLMVVGFGLAFGPVGAAIAAVIAAISMLVVGVKDWIETGNLSTETFYLIAAAIGILGIALAPITGGFSLLAAAAVIAGLTIYKCWDEICAWFEGLGEKFKEYGKAVLDWLAQGVGDFIETLHLLIGGPLESFIEEEIPATLEWFKDVGKNIVDGIKTGVSEKWDAMTKWFSDKWAALKKWWNGLSLGSFDFKTPHLSIAWEDIPADSVVARFLGFVKIPHFNINWYAKGGIVDGATLVGAGEAGKEAIIPLERHTEWIDMVAERLIDRITQSNRLADYISNMPLPALVTGQIAPPRALSGGGSMLTDGDIDRLVSGISAALTGGDSGGGEQVIKLYLDGRQIAETVTKHQRRMERGYA